MTKEQKALLLLIRLGIDKEKVRRYVNDVLGVKL
jgi:hypothetical protein